MYYKIKCPQLYSLPQEYYSLYENSKNGYTFRQWENDVKKMASSFCDSDKKNKFLGDMLEVFSELFFVSFQTDEAFGIIDYKPIDLTEDYGVDAVGRNVNGNHSVIQVKFRSNPNDLITYSDISKTYTSAILQLSIEDVYKYDRTVYVFTNSFGTTSSMLKIFNKKCIILNNGVISNKIDNNKNFWLGIYDMVYNSLD